jgi:galactose mutarotase-like enzyme
MNNAPFLCLEPWFGYSDTLDHDNNFTQKEGIQLLGKMETFGANFNIEIL